MCIKSEPRIDNSIQALKWRSKDSISEFASEFRTRSFPVAQAEFTADGWRLESPEVLALLKKLRNAGTPLGEYVGGKIYRGIITGLNEAFVVNGETRDRLLSEHPSSAEILKPFLRGRDVKRWRCEFANRYLIKIESSSNKKHPWSGKSPGDAEAIFAETYPAIHAHLNNHREALIRRDDQGQYFWELRSCAYWAEFEKAKIIYPDIYAKQSFGWQMDSCISANTSYFIPTHEKWLVALLNSAAVEWFYSLISNRVRGGYLRAFTDYVSQIPVPTVKSGKQSDLAKLVNEIETNQFDGTDLNSNERQIDQIVYKLYDLTADEIAIIEGRK
jgi:adenine-specific DNA-methyltransferase